MKNGRYSDAQIMAILKQVEGGTPVSELYREHGMAAQASTNGDPASAVWILGHDTISPAQDCAKSADARLIISGRIFDN
mgnify:CR=1 FL=1